MDKSNKLASIWQAFRRKAEGFFHAIKDKVFSDKMNDEQRAKVLLSAAAGVLIIVAAYSKTLAYDIYIGEDKIGSIRKKAELDIALDEISSDLSSTYDMDVVLEDELDLKRTNRTSKNIKTQEELKNTLKSRMNFLVEAYTLEVNDKEVGALKTKKEVENLLKRVKEPFIEEAKKNADLEDVKLLEKVLVKKENVPVYKIATEDVLEERLLYGGKNKDIHTVEVGETLWTIAKMYDMTMEELIEANKDRNPDKLQIGDEVMLVTSKPLLTVATTAKLAYEEDIDHEVEIEYNDNMYDNEKEVKLGGEKGRAKIESREIRHNGKVIKTEEVKRDILKEPKKEILVKGTKEVPKTRATGTLAMATRGRVSSRYGMRNGRMHKGLDIAASTGTPINASDGGKVTFAGYRGAYGYLVEIDHENGFKTRYAHCSKIHVKPGDRVYKGQQIANVGNTGRSTGPHLHIEVLKNGSHVNPSNYLK